MIDSTVVSGSMTISVLIGSTPSRRSVAVDDEHLVRLRRQLVEAPQVTQHDLERHVRPHGDVLEVHQRADHVVLEGHRGAQLLALLDRQALEHIVHHLLRQVGREIGDLVGFERLRRGDELLGIHRRDQRLADRVGDLEQDVAVARGPHPVPDVEPLVGRKRLEDVGDVGRVQPVELALQRGGALLVDRAFGELGVGLGRRLLALLADQPFDQPMLAQEVRHASERVLHAVRRVGSRRDGGLDGFGHGPDASASRRGRRKMPSARRPRPVRAPLRVNSTRSAQGTTAPGMRARIVATRPSR